MDAQRKTRQSEEYWRSHVERSKSFTGTVAEYCLANNLSKSNLNRYRHRFGAVNKKKRSAFVKLAPTIIPIETKVTNRGSRLLDPKWVAELLLALGGSER